MSNMLRIAIVLGIVLVVVFLVWRKQSGPRIGEIAPANKLQKKHGLYAENRPAIHIDPANVPEHLRDLIPMAEIWGIGDDIIRYDFGKKATADQKRAFAETLRGRTAEVNAWLDSFEDNKMSDESAHFMYMLIALEECGI